MQDYAYILCTATVEHDDLVTGYVVNTDQSWPGHGYPFSFLTTDKTIEDHECYVISVQTKQTSHVHTHHIY